MRPRAREADHRHANPEDRLEFRMEIVSNNGDALEKTGIVDPEDKTLGRRLFDVFL